MRVVLSSGYPREKKDTKKNTKKNTFIVLEMGANNTYVFLILGSLKMKNAYCMCYETLGQKY